MRLTLRAAALALLSTLAAAARPAAAQPSAQAPAGVQSAAVSNLRYTVTFDRTTAPQRAVKVVTSFATAGDAPVVLSLPAWTPGAYELSYFAKWVTDFAATGDGKALEWDKVDYDTWRVRPAGAKAITVSFTYVADTLDNAMAWARDDFLLANGTNLFLYPEGRGFDFPATVEVRTDVGWLVATGLHAAPRAGAAPGGAGAARVFAESNYHDLVDMPLFVGRFDYDSARVADRWVRYATYPAGLVTGAARAEAWEQLKKIIPAEVAVFGEAPFTDYTVMQIADTSFGGASGLEHQSSHVDVVHPGYMLDPRGRQYLWSLYAHEIFHAWNVKRLRPAEMWPYQYAREQPTPLLWVSEGITDYYADLALVRGGVVDSLGFLAATVDKMGQVAGAPPVALEDASLSTWIHPSDGTGYLYYPKGSLAGLMLDIMIRDASDNRKSLDDVMRQLYRDAFKAGRGFTTDEWWRAVSAAAGGKSFADFAARYVDGREAYPWATVFPLAGLRFVTDTLRRPVLGVRLEGDSTSPQVVELDPAGAATAAGLKVGDLLLAVGDVSVADANFEEKFTATYGARGTGPVAVPLRVRRGTQTLVLNARAMLQSQPVPRIRLDPAASPKAARIRGGILHGTVTP